MRTQVGVVDEIQMIASDDRGWAWTRAILVRDPLLPKVNEVPLLLSDIPTLECCLGKPGREQSWCVDTREMLTTFASRTPSIMRRAGLG